MYCSFFSFYKVKRKTKLYTISYSVLFSWVQPMYEILFDLLLTVHFEK